MLECTAVMRLVKDEEEVDYYKRVRQQWQQLPCCGCHCLLSLPAVPLSPACGCSQMLHPSGYMIAGSVVVMTVMTVMTVFSLGGRLLLPHCPGQGSLADV